MFAMLFARHPGVGPPSSNGVFPTNEIGRF